MQDLHLIRQTISRGDFRRELRSNLHVRVVDAKWCFYAILGSQIRYIPLAWEINQAGLSEKHVILA